MKIQTRPQTRERGGALIVATFTVALLSLTGALVLSHISSKYRNLAQATSWRKALVSAESGVDFAMQKLGDSLTDSTAAWTGWTTTNPNGGGTLPYSGKAYTGTALTFGGQGGTSMNFQVIIDSPPGLAAATRTKQYYRVRSTGYADLPATTRFVNNESLDTNLRKLSLRRDRKSGAAISTPRASRIIEVIVAPVTETNPTNTGHVKWEMSGFKNRVVAFDSTNSAYSTAGRYDPAKTIPADQAGIILATNQWHKDGATLGTLEKVDLNNSTVQGDFGLVGGTPKNATNVQGQTVTGYNVDLPKVEAPTWTTLTDPSLTKMEGGPNGSQRSDYAQWYNNQASAAMKAIVDLPSTNKNFVLYGGSTASSPTTYKLTKMKAEGKDKTIVFANPPGVSESWIEIWVTEETKVRDGGTLALEDGVHATVHFTKMLKVKDTKQDNGGTFVMSGYAGDLLFRGIELAESDKETDADFSPIKTSGIVKVKDSQFTGVIFAPDYDMELKTRSTTYPATQQYILGAITGRKIKLKGDTDFVTDLSLAQSGSVVTRYKVASWFEDSE